MNTVNTQRNVAKKLSVAGYALASILLMTVINQDTATAETNNRIVVIETEVELPDYSPIPFLAAEGHPVPEGSADEVFTSEDGKFSISIFEAAAGVVGLDDYPTNEFWVLLDGSVKFISPDGHKQQFGQGDTLMIPKGYTGRADMTKMRKLSISYNGN